MNPDGRIDWRIKLAATLAVIGLALVCWGAIEPTPLPLIVAMSIAQGLCVISILLFLWVVLKDLRRAGVIWRE